MINPFFENKGPKKIEEILNQIKFQNKLEYSGINITDIKDGRKPNTLVATIKSHCSNVPTLLIEHL